MPGSTDLGPGQAARRKPTDDGWEGYHMVTLEEMAEKVNVSDIAQVAMTGDYNDLLNTPSIPQVRRTETYNGNTDAQGEFKVTYQTPYAQIPDVRAQIVGGSFNQFLRVTNSTTTGFTVQVAQRSAVSLLGIEVLLAATTAVNNAQVSVLVTER